MDKYSEELVSKTISRTLLQKRVAETEESAKFVADIMQNREEELQSWLQLTRGRPCYQRTFLIHPLTQKCCAELITKVRANKKAHYLAKSEAKKYGDEVVTVEDAHMTLNFIKSSKVKDVLTHLVLCGCVLQAENITQELL